MLNTDVEGHSTFPSRGLTKAFLWAEAGTGLGCLMPITVEQSHQTDFRQTRNLRRLLFKKKPGHIWTMCESNSSSCGAWRGTAVSLLELAVFLFQATNVLPSPNQRHQTLLRPITKVPWSSHANTLSEVIPQPSPLMRPTTSDYTVRLKSVLWRVPLQKVDYSGYNSPAALGYYYLRYRL